MLSAGKQSGVLGSRGEIIYFCSRRSPVAGRAAGIWHEGRDWHNASVRQSSCVFLLIRTPCKTQSGERLPSPPGSPVSALEFGVVATAIDAAHGVSIFMAIALVPSRLSFGGSAAVTRFSFSPKPRIACSWQPEPCWLRNIFVHGRLSGLARPVHGEF
jgi:hypothetical protein